MRLLLIAIATVFMVAASVLSIMANSAKQQDARQVLAGSDTVWSDARHEPDVSDAIPPQVLPPILTIGGKEGRDVYLQSLDIQIEVTGNIASTRHTMVFKNRTNRVLEGELTFPLPDGRTVTHYALDIDGKMREAVPVEKARATQVFEEIQRREVDPGILEKVEGNNFRTRIYPIPAKGVRTISIGYEEELALENDLQHYRLPMAYPNPLEEFAVKATVWKGGVKPVALELGDEDGLRFDRADENHVASLVRKNYRPSRALNFALPAPVDVPRVMMQPAQESFYFLASVAPKMEARKKRWGDELAIIWDVSLSGSQRDLRREMAALNTVFAEKKNVDVHLYFLNNRLTKIVDKNTANGEYKVIDGNWGGLRNALVTAVFDGGTDFSQINLNDIAGNEILFFSDGISTLSDADFLKNNNRPIHCIVSSSSADYSAMKLIAGKTKGKFVNINALSSAKLKNELLNETPMFLGAEYGKDVREVYPNIATAVHGNFSIAGICGGNNAELTLLFGFGGKVERRVKVKLDAKKADKQGNIHRIWAQKKIAELDMEYEKNRAELAELGQLFGIVTRNTTLMVLELVSDYVRYGIEPPASESELRAEYQRRGGAKASVPRTNTSGTASGRVRGKRRVAATDFFEKLPEVRTAKLVRESIWTFETEKGEVREIPDDEKIFKSVSVGDPRRVRITGVHDNYTGSIRNEARIERGEHQRYRRYPWWEWRQQDDKEADMLNHAVIVAEYMKNWWNTDFKPRSYPKDKAILSIASSTEPEKTLGGESSGTPGDSVSVFLKNMTGKAADDYQIYLKLRNDYVGLPAFYFDMADWFYKLGDRETALRVLTSIAELELENASLYRLLGYKFKEYGEYTLQKFVCHKVVQWRPMDPQSHRDYALALADNGEAQAALDSLYKVITRFYPMANIYERNDGIEEVVITEINRLIAKNPKINTSKIDKRLIMNMPVDVRVVINWNMNNTDIDLYVKDPNNEYCNYRRYRTSIGGRISANNKSGYGPEQFMLKRAVRGKYQIYADYRSAREFAADGPSTVMAEIYTEYYDKTEQRQIVCLQLSRAAREDGKVKVAEFELGDPYLPWGSGDTVATVERIRGDIGFVKGVNTGDLLRQVR